MAHIVYEVVEHDGGWAYRLGDVFSETFPDHASALQAARIAAAEHEQRGETLEINYQGADGLWRDEIAPGDDRPETEVKDS